ncbi:MAG: hypothetical protein M1292_06765, partial [Bacteroidetes bacterium]|nr:hypothetical protein [Bacteroidota bacterium]
MAKLLDDPTIQDYLKGVNPNLPPEEPGFQTQTQQFVPNSVFPEQQQRVADNPALMDTPANTTVPDPAVQPAAAQPPKITSILDLIRANEPVQDPTLDARYKKAAMLDSLGQAFGNLAGAVGVGIGATVPKLPVDNNIARLYGARDTEKQRLLQQKRDWDRQMLQGAIQEMGMSAQERKDKEAADRWQKDYDLKVSDNKAKWADATAKAKNQAEKDEATRVYREKDLAIKEKNANTSAFRASQS